MRSAPEFALSLDARSNRKPTPDRDDRPVTVSPERREPQIDAPNRLDHDRIV